MAAGRTVTPHAGDAAQTGGRRRGAASRLPVHPATLVVLVAATVVGAAARLWQLRGRPSLVWNDSADFVATAAAPWWSLELWAGARTPATPALLKLVGADAYIVWQAVLAVTCWAVLAASVSTVVGGRWLRWLAASAVVGISLTAPVTMWERSVLSESLAISLLALVVAAGVQLARGATAPRVAVALAALAAWLATRDSHAVVALLGGGALLAVAAHAWWRSSRRRHRDISSAGVTGPDKAGMSPGVEPPDDAATTPAVEATPAAVAPPTWVRPAAALGLGAVTLALAVSLASTHGERHAFPIRNVYEVRVLPYPERVRWLADHGMPQADEFLGAGARQPHTESDGPPVVYVADEDVALAPWRAWVESDGRAAFAAYVAAHPGYLVSEPLRSPERAFNNAFGDRGFYAPPDLPRVPVVDRVLALPTAVVMMVAGLVGGWALVRRRRSPALVAGVVVAGLAVPHGLFAWHSDGMETARHLAVPALQFHVGVLLVVLGAVSAVSGRSGAVGAADAEGARPSEAPSGSA